MITITDLPPSLAERIDPKDGHWLWTGWTNSDGYGYVSHDGRDQPAHRVVFETLVSEIPPGLELDHLCITPACVFPEHVEPVTHAENMRRLSQRQTCCRRAGHDWTVPRNVRTRPDGRRYCAECDRISMRARHARKKVA